MIPCFAPSAAFAQSPLSLDEAIEQAAAELSAALPAGAKAAIINIDAPSSALGDYILEESTKLLLRQQKLVLVDRKDLDLIRGEEQFQLSGEVSDETAQRIGHKLGAQIILSGSFTSVDKNFRLLLKALEVESARVLSLVSFPVRSGRALLSLLSGGAPASPDDWKRRRFYIGLSGGFSYGFYEHSGGLVDSSVYARPTLTGAPAFEGGLSLAVSVLDFLEIRPGIFLGPDQAELFSGSRSLMKVSSMSLYFPLTAALVLRPSIFMIRGFVGMYLALPLGPVEVSHGNGSWTAEYQIPPGFIGGVGGGVKFGPGVVFTEFRYLTDFGDTTANHNGKKDLYRRSKAALSLGYELGLLRKK